MVVMKSNDWLKTKRLYHVFFFCFSISFTYMVHLTTTVVQSISNSLFSFNNNEQPGKQRRGQEASHLVASRSARVTSVCNEK